MQYVTALPCGQGIPTEAGNTCLDQNWMTAIAGCKAGLPAPAGVSDTVWSALCARLSQCGVDTLPGCPSYDKVFAAGVPACLDDSYLQGLSYCDKYPLFDGPTKAMNSLCWAASKSPTYLAKVQETPHCAAGDGSGGGTTQASMSTTTMALYGIGAAAVIGLGYMMLRKK